MAFRDLFGQGNFSAATGVIVRNLDRANAVKTVLTQPPSAMPLSPFGQDTHYDKLLRATGKPNSAARAIVDEAIMAYTQQPELAENNRWEMNLKTTTADKLAASLLAHMREEKSQKA